MMICGDSVVSVVICGGIVMTVRNVSIIVSLPINNDFKLFLYLPIEITVDGIFQFLLNNCAKYCAVSTNLKRTSYVQAHHQLCHNKFSSRNIYGRVIVIDGHNYCDTDTVCWASWELAYTCILQMCHSPYCPSQNTSE